MSPALLGALLLGAAIRDPAAILQRIDGLIGEDARAASTAVGTTWPPDAVVLRIFKQEREIEIWAKARTDAQMKLVRTLPVCAMDFEPGPKLRQGDGKTPEGFFHPDFGYASRNWWMWIDLDHVDDSGAVDQGSCFKMCLDYPNALDRQRTQRAGYRDPGGEICLHGNCVSIGCASMKNQDFLWVFDFARHHDARTFGPLQVHIFPFRFDRVDPQTAETLAQAWPGTAGAADLLSFWANLRHGWEAFNANPNPLKIGLGKDGYTFE